MPNGPSHFANLRHMASRAIGRRRLARSLGHQSDSDVEAFVRAQPGLTVEERAALCLVGGSRAIELARACSKSRAESEDGTRRLRERLTAQARRIGTILRDDSRFVGSQTASILLVDDDQQVLAVLTRMLQRAGHEVMPCGSVEEAQRHLTNGLKPTLLITDVALGTSTGKRVAESVQRQSPKTRVIFISGYANIAVGGQPVLQKPFSSKELIELVDQVLSADTQSGAHRLESEFAASRKKH